MTKANAAPLFRGLKRQNSFNKNIHVVSGDGEDIYLRECRRKIRAALRATFGDLKAEMSNEVHSALLSENRGDLFKQKIKQTDLMDVRFLTQGSHAYQTLVRPYWTNQEIDLDDGVYLPMPFIDGRPLFASAGLFAIIQRSLEPLVEKEGWQFGRRKDTCIRIKLPRFNAHIDLPIFAVESQAFSVLRDQLEARLNKSLKASANLYETLHGSMGRDQRLGGAEILLAHRQEDWKASDPKTIHDWFEEKVRTHGQILRRVCRYLKSWRDKAWQANGPSSIALMAIAVSIFDELQARATETRDDALTLLVVEKMSDKIRQGNIRGPNELPPFDASWGSSDRLDYAQKADEFAAGLTKALRHSGDKQSVVDELIFQFGQRFPNEPDSVVIDVANEVETITRSMPAKVAAPVVGNSVSG